MEKQLGTQSFACLDANQIYTIVSITLHLNVSITATTILYIYYIIQGPCNRDYTQDKKEKKGLENRPRTRGEKPRSLFDIDPWAKKGTKLIGTEMGHGRANIYNPPPPSAITHI